MNVNTKVEGEVNRYLSFALSPTISTIVAIVANIALATIFHALAVPLFFDSVFTFLLVYRHGLLAGLVCAVGTNSALALLSMVPFPFVACHLLTALGAWVLFHKHSASWTRFLLAGVLAAITNGIAGSMIAFYVFQGVTSVNPIDNLVLGLVATGQAMFGAVFWGGLASNLVDKLISVSAAFAINQGLERLAASKSRNHPELPSEQE